MVERFDRLWRLIATALSFFAFGVGGLVLWVVVFPVVALAVREPDRRARCARGIIHVSFRVFVWMMRGLGVLTYEVHGREKLSREGLLVLANHPSLIDVVFLISFLPRADCVVKAALLANPFTRGPVLAAGFVCNNVGPAMVESCIASIRSGNHLIIFPEGTRSRPGQALKLQRGAANVAVRGGIDVTPVLISCDPPTLTKDTPWWKVPARRPHFCIVVRDDLCTAELVRGVAGEALAARRLTDRLTDYFTLETRRDHGHHA